MRILGVIPARWASSRFPGKPLAIIKGRSMVMRVYDKVIQAGVFDKVLVATEDERILHHVHACGGNALMTSSTHQSGTERCAEALELMMRKTGHRWDGVINIQGDEPLVDPNLLRILGQEFQPQGSGIMTLASPILLEDELVSPNTVKVVCDLQGNALYFSRAVIPCIRDIGAGQHLSAYPYLRHLGLYAYYSQTLLDISTLPDTPLEKAESLEQLRWLSHGHPIRVLVTNISTTGVDVPEDIQKVEDLLDDCNE